MIKDFFLHNFLKDISPALTCNTCHFQSVVVLPFLLDPHQDVSELS